MTNEKKDNNITLKFIEDYRSLSVLWDRNQSYSKKMTRNEGLTILATRYNMDIDGVKKKIKDLRSHFIKDEEAEISYHGENSVQDSDEHEFAQPPVRKRLIKNEMIDSTEEEGHQFVEKSSEELSNGPKDEFSIYGELIAHKIRKLNSYNRLIAQKRINSVLFDVEMEQIMP